MTGDIIDSVGNKAALYPEVIICLNLLKEIGIPLAIASRIANVAGGYQLLHLFGIKEYFNYVEIYPTGKRLHFRRLSKKTGIAFQEMVFYDDDYRNIKDIRKLGVLCNMVENGVAVGVLLPLINLLKSVYKR